MCCTILTEALH
ncbi:hypothetical protein SPV_2513 [Streptococcus pneumoniae]|nr:hypothetical protein SPV_2513 [Streptococcus pneumoniae]